MNNDLFLKNEEIPDNNSGESSRGNKQKIMDILKNIPSSTEYRGLKFSFENDDFVITRTLWQNKKPPILAIIFVFGLFVFFSFISGKYESPFIGLRELLFYLDDMSFWIVFSFIIGLFFYTTIAFIINKLTIRLSGNYFTIKMYPLPLPFMYKKEINLNNVNYFCYRLVIKQREQKSGETIFIKRYEIVAQMCGGSFIPWLDFIEQSDADFVVTLFNLYGEFDLPVGGNDSEVLGI